MLADPIEKKVKSTRTPGDVIITSTLAGRGNTGVDFHWYNWDEFKQLTQDQKDKLIEWQGSDAGKAVIKANKSKAKAERLAKKRKEGEDGNSKIGGSDDDGKVEKAKLQKKY